MVKAESENEEKKKKKEKDWLTEYMHRRCELFVGVVWLGRSARTLRIYGCGDIDIHWGELSQLGL